MDRRQFLNSLGAAAAGLAVGGSAIAASSRTVETEEFSVGSLSRRDEVQRLADEIEAFNGYVSRGERTSPILLPDGATPPACDLSLSVRFSRQNVDTRPAHIRPPLPVYAIPKLGPIWQDLRRAKPDFYFFTSIASCLHARHLYADTARVIGLPERMELEDPGRPLADGSLYKSPAHNIPVRSTTITSPEFTVDRDDNVSLAIALYSAASIAELANRNLDQARAAAAESRSRFGLSWLDLEFVVASLPTVVLDISDANKLKLRVFFQFAGVICSNRHKVQVEKLKAELGCMYGPLATGGY